MPHSTPMGDIKSQGIKSILMGDVKSNHLKKKYVADLLKHSYKQVFFCRGIVEIKDVGHGFWN